MKFYSQAGQDRAAHALLVEGMDIKAGAFVDIGACHPVEKSNSYGLEQIGWRGILFDNDPGAVALLRQHRSSPVVEGDATKHHYRNLLLISDWIARAPDGSEVLVPSVHDVTAPDPWANRDFHYLSLDVDGASLAVLQNLPLPDLRFYFITAEHDMYSRGPGMRDAMRAIFRQHGYKLVCGDVKDMGLPFEDWWVHPEIVPADLWEPHVCQGKEWQEIKFR